MTDARKRLPELADNAKHHNQITILTRQGKDIAAICPVPEDPVPQQVDEASHLGTSVRNAETKKPPTAVVPTEVHSRKSGA